MNPPAISVVIPVLNEAVHLGRLLAALKLDGSSPEIIVVDGGSEDHSRQVAREYGVIVLDADRGRGSQLLAGTEIAKGELLWFLHADTDLPAGALAAMIRVMMEAPEALGGNFRLLFDGQRRFDRWLEGFYDWLRRRGLYYGDSGIFIRRKAFRSLGGIRPIPVMEDYDLVKRMEAAGVTVCVREPPLLTSSRRFHGRHPLAIFLGWMRMHLMYHLGVSPVHLARLYDNERRKQRTVPGRSP